MNKTAGIPYVIVAGHFPVWTIGEHGPTKCLVDQLRPLLHKYKVSAYMSGHDHSLQHLTDTYLNTTVQYIISGAGSKLVSSTANINNVPANSLKFNWPKGFEILNGGFVFAKATRQALSIQYMKADGTVLYQTNILPRV